MLKRSTSSIYYWRFHTQRNNFSNTLFLRVFGTKLHEKINNARRHLMASNWHMAGQPTQPAEVIPYVDCNVITISYCVYYRS